MQSSCFENLDHFRGSQLPTFFAFQIGGDRIGIDELLKNFGDVLHKKRDYAKRCGICGTLRENCCEEVAVECIYLLSIKTCESKSEF